MSANSRYFLLLSLFNKIGVSFKFNDFLKRITTQIYWQKKFGFGKCVGPKLALFEEAKSKALKLVIFDNLKSQ